jgi:large subunit ribosomal protein L20
MPRSTNAPASRERRRRRLKLARGFRAGRSKRFRMATEAVDRSMRLAYKHRKQRKGEFRRLWTVRISAACRAEGMPYSRLMDGLRKAGILLNRKMLSEIAFHDSAGFAAIVAKAKAAL